MDVGGHCGQSAWSRQGTANNIPSFYSNPYTSDLPKDGHFFSTVGKFISFVPTLPSFFLFSSRASFLFSFLLFFF